MDVSSVRKDARNYFQPILLGNNKTSRRLSRKIFRKHGIRSLILDEKTSLANLCLFSHRFVRIAPTNDASITLMQLAELSTQLQDMLPILIPCSEKYERDIEIYRSELETVFVLSTPQDILWESPLNIIP